MYFDFQNPIETAAIKAYHKDPWKESDVDMDARQGQELKDVLDANSSINLR